MQFKLLMVPPAFGIALLIAIFTERQPLKQKQEQVRMSLARTAIRCGPDWNELKEWIEESDIPPIPGAGAHQWKIRTISDSAQFYFNQGVNTYYGFHIIEAMASFKKAARFDSSSAMIQWAQALTYGPNINDLGYTASPDALVAINNAVSLSAHATGKERSLIEAQQARYSTDSTLTRAELNQRYADKMKEAYLQYPGDADIAVLYVDALMLQHPWDLWSTDGTPKAWTPLIENVLEKVLATVPDHPGANHYYIHLMEPSPFAGKAMKSADRLGKLAPGLSHLVHMPSHIYLRTGEYGKGVDVNIAAVKSYERTVALYAPVTGNDFLYVIHNRHMQANNAMMEGNAARAMEAANETAASINPDYLTAPGALGNTVQYVYMTPVLVQIRFGKWTDLLSTPHPASSLVYANILYRLGRGMALVHERKLEDATKELDSLHRLMADTVLSIPMTPFSPAMDGAVIAENLLAGSIDLAGNHKEEAIEKFKKAVGVEENMVYNEPRDWLLNPKHYLGDAYLKAGKWEAARQIFERDFLNNKENGWALMGLYQSLLAGKKKTEAERVHVRYQKAFLHSDITLENAVF